MLTNEEYHWGRVKALRYPLENIAREITKDEVGNERAVNINVRVLFLFACCQA